VDAGRECPAKKSPRAVKEGVGQEISTDVAATTKHREWVFPVREESFLQEADAG
jgi:hypothetical protein